MLTDLDDPSPSIRLRAAQSLRDATPPKLEAIPALVAHLEDDGFVDEEWTDWDGSVVGGTRHLVAACAGEALAKMGAPAFEAVLEAARGGAPGAIRSVAPMAARLTPNQLCLTGRPGLLEAAQRVHGLPDSGPGHAALLWAVEELDRAEDRLEVLRRRLDHPDALISQAAAVELGRSEPAARAARIVATALLRRPATLSYSTMAAAGAALRALGPVLEDTQLHQLLAVVDERAMFPAWPGLFPALGAHGERARSLGPRLVRWVIEASPPVHMSPEYHAEVRAAAASALGLLGVAAAPHRAALVAAFLSGPEAVRGLVLKAIPDTSVLAAACLDELVRRLSGTDPTPVADALDRIANLGQAAADAIGSVLPFLEKLPRPGPNRSAEVNVYRAATRAAGAMGEAGRAAVPALIAALDEPRDVRFWAIYGLNALGREVAREGIPAMVENHRRRRAQGDNDPDLRTVLGYLGAKSK